MRNLAVGIDKIGFYMPRYYLDLATLTTQRGSTSELGQHKMAITPPGEDIITMAANAASQILTAEDKQHISAVFFATESGIDYSKAASTYVHSLLGLPTRCRVIELKQACYAATFGLHMAMHMLQHHPKQKVLLLSADIARYGLHTRAESSQGAGAIAMLLTSSPRLANVEQGSGLYTEDTMDFWHPNYLDEALVDGKYSCDLYLKVLAKVWANYQEVAKRSFAEHDYFCYHASIPKLVEQAHRKLCKLNAHNVSRIEAKQAIANSLNYIKEVGNCYTASLYISLLALLETSGEDLTEKRIGMYSYGSGCMGEYFSLVVNKDYRQMLHTDQHQKLLEDRKQLTYAEYEQFYNFCLPQDGTTLNIPRYNTGKFSLVKMQGHKRFYESVA